MRAEGDGKNAQYGAVQATAPHGNPPPSPTGRRHRAPPHLLAAVQTTVTRGWCYTHARAPRPRSCTIHTPCRRGARTVHAHAQADTHKAFRPSARYVGLLARAHHSRTTCSIESAAAAAAEAVTATLVTAVVRSQSPSCRARVSGCYFRAYIIYNIIVVRRYSSRVCACASAFGIQIPTIPAISSVRPTTVFIFVPPSRPFFQFRYTVIVFQFFFSHILLKNFPIFSFPNFLSLTCPPAVEVFAARPPPSRLRATRTVRERRARAPPS